MGNASVGGAKDVSNFVGCLDSKQMPDIASLTYEGLYYDYYFQTKNEDEKEDQKQLIHPTYSCAKTKIPQAMTMLQSIKSKEPQPASQFKTRFSNEQLKIFFQYFKQLDTDCDGFLTSEQFISSQLFIDYALTTEVVDAVMSDGSNKMDFSDFVTCLESSKKGTEDDTARETQAEQEQEAEEEHGNKPEYEYYMSIGLNSRIDSNNLKRNKLNLVVCIDNSGSMSSSFTNSSQSKRELPPQCPMCNKFLKTSAPVMNSVDVLMGEHIDSNCTKLVVNEEEQIQLEQLCKTEKKCVMDVAKQSLLSLLQQLNDDDRFGLTVFNNECTVYQPLTTVKDIDMNKLKAEILKIQAGGGTNMELAYKTSTSLYDDFFAKQEEIEEENAYVKVQYPSPSGGDDNDDDDVEVGKEGSILDEYWNRIIFITDAQPNTGKTDAESIMNMIQKNSDADALQMDKIHKEIVETDDPNEQKEAESADMHPIYTTFIGVGLNMNAALIDEITKVRGCNYYSVHSNEEFMRQMTEEFKFMVTPIAFDFKLELRTEGNGMCIENVYGSGDDHQNKEFGFEVMNVSTLFPSPYNETKEIKGGIVLLKLKTNADNDIMHNMELDVSYKEVETGKIYTDKQRIVFGERNKNKNVDEDYFDHVGVRKAVLLTRYVQLLKQWMYSDKRGDRLYVSQEFKDIFAHFIAYFKEEMKQINDDVLKKEVSLMQLLVDC